MKQTPNKKHHQNQQQNPGSSPNNNNFHLQQKPTHHPPTAPYPPLMPFLPGQFHNMKLAAQDNFSSGQHAQQSTTPTAGDTEATNTMKQNPKSNPPLSLPSSSNLVPGTSSPNLQARSLSSQLQSSKHSSISNYDVRKIPKSNNSNPIPYLQLSKSPNRSGAEGSAAPLASVARTSRSSSSFVSDVPSAIEFSPNEQSANVYACINCAPLDDNGNDCVFDSTRNMEGPVLVELRCLEFTRPSYLEEEELKPGYDKWSSKHLCYSRGTAPTLTGHSAYSTCLSFAPSAPTHDYKIATGMSNGAVCIHSFSSTEHCQKENIAYFAAPKNNNFRPATCVTWRDNSSSHHVAVGISSHTNSSSSASSNTEYHPHNHPSNKNKNHPQPKLHRKSRGNERDFGCFVWDVEAQSQSSSSTATASTTKSTSGNSTPLHRFALGNGVASLCWCDLDDGAENYRNASLLAIGCQSKLLQLYDVRMCARLANSPPISIVAHGNCDPSNGGKPCEVMVRRGGDDGRYLVTFAKNALNEPVKLWDLRRMDSPWNEIKTSSFLVDHYHSGGATNHNDDDMVVGGGFDITLNAKSSTHNQDGNGIVLTDVAWSANNELALAVGDCLRYFDIPQTGGKPTLSRMQYTEQDVDCIAFQSFHGKDDIVGLSPRQEHGLAVIKQHSSNNIKKKVATYLRKHPTNSTVCFSNRDGRIAHSYDNQIWMGSSSDQRVPSVMELAGKQPSKKQNQDISAIMLRRARCLHVARYSTDAVANLQNLTQEEPDEDDSVIENEGGDEQDKGFFIAADTAGKDREALWRLWSWIERIEFLSNGGGGGGGGGATTTSPGEEQKSPIPSQQQQDIQQHLLSSQDKHNQRSVMASKEREGATPSVVWSVKGLMDAGVWNLLKMNNLYTDRENNNGNSGKEQGDCLLDENESVLFLQSLFCNTYESHWRRTALTACGWTSKFGLQSILSDCEANGNFERAAALAVFHGELHSAVASLQRGSEVRRKWMDGQQKNQCASLFSHRYAETMLLVAMCIAGYSGNVSSNATHTHQVWCSACESLLQRKELSSQSNKRCQTHIAYLRAACIFLLNIHRKHNNHHPQILHGEPNDNHNNNNQSNTTATTMSLSDRVAFACSFLPRNQLSTFLYSCIETSLARGDIEAILITGLDKRGLSLVQSYVDRTSDVQTAALVCSRVILPTSWVEERVMCSEWVYSYRDLLNTWQMWQSRATFDVGRAELLRKLHKRQLMDDNVAAATNNRSFTSTTASSLSLSSRQRYNYTSGGSHTAIRRGPAGANMAERRNTAPTSSTTSISTTAETTDSTLVPPQLFARCNYCNTTLPLSKLRRQEGFMANSWLSRQKPILSCCPQCKQPLPRCAVCLLPLGCLNPYLELKRERNDRKTPNNHNNCTGSVGIDDLSGLANLPFAEWFTWCMRCKHGGHAHHLVGWFGNHETCPVSGCDCRCQFDGIQKIARGN